MSNEADRAGTPAGVFGAELRYSDPADIEAQATVLRWYEPLVVPGLLQTEDYARAILSGTNGWASALVHPRRRPSPAS